MGADCNFSGCQWGKGHDGPHDCKCQSCDGTGGGKGPDTCPQCGGIGRVDLGRPLKWGYDLSVGYWKADSDGASLLAWHDPTHESGPCWRWCVQRNGQGDVHGRDSQRWKAMNLAEKEAM